jgi:hypothetical protein
MGSFSDYLEKEILDHIFKVGAYSVPYNLYVGLSTGTFTTTADAYTGTTVASEVSGGAYVRKKCNTWDVASNGATANTGAVTFAQATADWGTVKCFFIADKTTLGNIICWGSLSTAKAVSSGDTLKFATGEKLFYVARTSQIRGSLAC